ncbi:MAG: choice-of-anchor Q domain-containing protein [Alcanivoracaceae bacterium]|nr:choice-of-anchor Q domain-containing protein [Alcanivoracaceae bacterium]
MKTDKSTNLFRMQALAAAIGLASGAAHAVNPVVTNLDDSGPGSFRDALQAANNDEGVASTLTFAEGLSGTISLQSSLPQISDSLEIVGTGITVRGGPDVESAVIRFYAESEETFTVRGLSITDGVAGGLYAYLDDGSSMLLEDVVITKNSGGPGVEVRSGEMDIVNSVISGNSNQLGPDGSYGDGGGIDARYADLEVVGSEITDNIAGSQSGEGGGINVRYGSLLIERSVIEGNTAGRRGGGIRLNQYEDGDLTVVDSTISGNAAENGAGISLYSYRGGNLEVRNSSITGNRAESSDDGYIKRLVRRGSSTGGGIQFYSGRYREGSVLLENAVIKNNSADSAGGLQISSESVDIVSSLIDNNSASESNGGFSIRANNLSISQSTISGNSAPERAAGAIFSHSEYSEGMSIDSSTISGHSSKDGNVLSVSSGDYGSIAISNSTISGNTARDAVVVVGSSRDNYSSINILNSTFSGNKSTNAPAAIELTNNDITVTHSTFVDNKASSSELFDTSVQLSILDTDEGTTTAQLVNSVFTSGNDAEVQIGGDQFNFYEGYSSGYSVSADISTVIMANNVAIAESSSSEGSVTVADPQLAPLGYRGGFTLVHEPLPGSPAIDAGSEGSRPDGRDQRGIVGNFGEGGNSDLGSVEVVSNTSPRLTVNLSKQIKGVLGTEIPVFNVTDLFVDDEGDNISVVNVTGLPAGLYSEGSNIGGTLEAAGTFAVTVVVTDDNATPLETVEQFEVTIPEKKSSSDSEVLGSVPAGFLALLSFMAILRRRNS